MRKYIIFALIVMLFLSGSMAIEQKTDKKTKNNMLVCPENIKGVVRCNARIIVGENGQPFSSFAPVGYGPNQFLGAYNLPGSAPSTRTIAIVDAYDDPNIYSDLTTYSQTFGLPTLPKCIGSYPWSNPPCFAKVNQNGGSSPLPARNSVWATEISLDVEIAHAICKNCSIYLVEAKSAFNSDMYNAEDQAAKFGTIISNSWGEGEYPGEINDDIHFYHPGKAITFSSGDNGYGPQYPAASPYVTAVGGTTLNVNGITRSSETVWSGTGSGCSSWESQPYFQNGLVLSVCSNRIIADVSADADPNTGAAIYDSIPYYGYKGWFQVGGTSLSSPIIAGTYATGAGISPSIQANSIPYSNVLPYPSSIIYDITSGSNGGCGNVLCIAGPGYDGPTGLGTPNTNAAFTG
jgi:subtilase family serine protease